LMPSVDDLTDGARALKRSGKTGAELARLCGVSAQLVSLWLKGKKRPGPEHRARLEALGLALADQWEKDSSKRRKAHSSPAMAHAAPATALDTRSELVEQVGRLRRLIGEGLSPAASVQVERALGQALVALSKIDGTTITELTIVRHPAHRRVMAVILAALEPYPEAMRAVADALKAREG
jgi:transcriptional regulator with XRE-family HTH domain